MRILYPYNEILPKKRAHDVFIFHECSAFADLGWDVTLLTGRGSPTKDLFAHYHVEKRAHFHLETALILRKNTIFNVSWNLPFFLATQRTIKKTKPDYVFLSVRKQGAYHLSRPLPGVRYVYEVHELLHYPNSPSHSPCEREFLAHADLVTVTTEALKDILLSPPYSLTVPIEVIPLAVNAHPLPPPIPHKRLQIFYVGQLYKGQGIPLLLAAIARVPEVELTLLGGSESDLCTLRIQAEALGIHHRVHFLGFVAPHQIPAIVKSAHAFVAPFEDWGRMPYVAHTKLFEYAAWGRPIVVPQMAVVEEHFKGGKGVLFFTPGDALALAGSLQILLNEEKRNALQREIEAYAGQFTWHQRAQRYARLLG